MSGIKWEEPPHRKNSFNWAPLAQALRERPGRWAMIREATSSSYASHIKQGVLSAFRPAGHFDATTVSRGDGKFDIYARYVGDEVSA